MLLGCLVDGGGTGAFGTVYAATPDEGRAVVRRCKAAGFVQMKIYDLIRPEVLIAICAEAHRLGMTVTGHIPHGLDAIQGVEDGMDQINHFGYIMQVAKAADPAEPLRVDSPGVQKVIAFFRDHHTVIDPTQSWGELLGRPRNVPIASFEPGYAKAPYTLTSVIGTSGAPPSDRGDWGMTADSAVLLKALYDAGVPIVAGTDKALPAHSLHRELELYVKAGLTPMQVIKLATSGSARVMGMAGEVGAVSPGQRADLILVAGDPLADFSALRRVTRVVTDGRMYDPAPLWRSVGFKP
jgi:imidazolonepropionase-like amidohydrolase